MNEWMNDWSEATYIFQSQFLMQLSVSADAVSYAKCICNHHSGPCSNLPSSLGTFRQHTYKHHINCIHSQLCNITNFLPKSTLEGSLGQGLCLLCFFLSSRIIREWTLDKCLLDKWLNEQSNVHVYINRALFLFWLGLDCAYTESSSQIMRQLLGFPNYPSADVTQLREGWSWRLGSKTNILEINWLQCTGGPGPSLNSSVSMWWVSEVKRWRNWQPWGLLFYISEVTL